MFLVMSFMPWPRLPPRNKNFVASFSFLCLVTRHKNVLTKKDLNKDVFFSSAFSLESFKFNDKNIRIAHIKNVGQRFVGIDVSKAVGYNDDDNARRAVRTHVPGKYRICLGDAQNILRKEVDTDLLPREDIVLLKEPGLYCFLLRCK